MVVCICCAAGLVGAAIALRYYERLNDEAYDALHSLRASAAAKPKVSSPQLTDAIELPEFNGADFAAEFNQIASEAGLPVEELAYALEAGAAQPYLRYRMTLEVKAGYPELRRFIAAMSAAQPNVSLDSVRCRREDVATAPVICQLALSAFFRKAAHA